MKDIKKSSWHDLSDWRELFEAMTTGIIVIDSEKNKIKRYNKSAKEIFSPELEPEKIITEVDHRLVYEELGSDLGQINKDHPVIKKIIPTKKGDCFVIGIEGFQSAKEETGIVVLSFVDVTDLRAELEQKVEAEKQLQREILEVEKKERWRLGQFLHDTAAQNLLSIKMLLDLLDPQLQKLDEETRTELDKIKRLIVKTEKSLRELSRSVLPIGDEEKVSEAFQTLVEQTEDLYGVTCDFKSEKDINKIEGVASASSLYYISQEAIRNAIHHGQADKIAINLSFTEDVLFLTIKDNGIGYEEGEEGKGMGINIMRHRAELLGGTLEIKKGPDSRGTTVTCHIPLERLQKGEAYS